MSRYFGWTLDYILSLTPLQIQAMFKGLGEVLNPDGAAKNDFEKQKEDSTKILDAIKKFSGIKGKKVMTPAEVGLLVRSTK